MISLCKNNAFYRNVCLFLLLSNAKCLFLYTKQTNKPLPMTTNPKHYNIKANHDKYSQSIMQIVAQSVRDDWDYPAFTDYGTATTYTRHTMAEQIMRLHILLDRAGIERGDKIAICDRSSANWAVVFYAIFTYGAVAVPILHDFHTDQIESIYAHSDARLIFCNRRLYSSTTSIPAEQMIDIATLTTFEQCQLTSIMQEASDTYTSRYPDGMKASDVEYADVDMDSLAILSYTSGSTGNPKGVMIPYRAIWSNTYFAEERLPLAHHANVISLLPLAHMYGFAFEFFFAFTIGSHIYFLSKAPSPRVVLAAFAQLRPIIILAVPLIIEKIIQSQVMPLISTPRMRFLLSIPLVNRLIYKHICKRLTQAFGGNFYEVIIGGAALNQDVESILQRIGFAYTVGYGMTECAPLICYEDWHEFAPHSCGKVIPRMEVKILSDNPEHTPGELVCRGTNVMLGYYKNEEATSLAIDADGWLHTGDLAVMDSLGNITIRGRMKSMLLGSNGQNVYPEEIEDRLISLPVIDECVVVQRGDKLVGLVYSSEQTLRHHGMTLDTLKSSIEQYRRQVNQRLPKFAALQSLEVQDVEFEKTPKRNIKRYLYG